MPIRAEESALESRLQLNSCVINLYWAPGPKTRVGLPPKKCTCPPTLNIKGTYWYIWSVYDEGKEGWDKLGKFWWLGEEGRSIGVRAQLKIGSLS